MDSEASKRVSISSSLLLLIIFGGSGFAQQVSGQDIDKILERADKLLEEAKSGYESASTKGSVEAFVEAGFKLEEARIKYLVLQEIGSADKQKIAADQLRAVNQLSKLIHDGKVAISGSAAEPASAKPSEAPPPAPAKDPAANPPIDVGKRAQIPDPAKQREAEKLIKDLFKEQYSKKTPADRKILIRLLLDQAAKSQDDPVALWVLCREIQDLSVQSCDVTSALASIETAARVFDVDAMSMKNTALLAAGKTAKTPEELGVLATTLQKLIDEYVRADQYDSADKAAIFAVQCARRSTDTVVITRATTRAKEVTEAKTLFQSMKSVMQTQAKNPDDPGANLEIGRFLCFVKGTWDLGLRFIVKGSDPALKALAEKELGIPMQAAERAALADGWYDLAEKDKSPLRKSQLLAHARTIYGSALSDATALLRARIEKRLGEMDAGAAAAEKRFQIDLLKMMDPDKDSTNGKWRMEAGMLVSPRSAVGAPSPNVAIPYVPPDEYDLSIVVERMEAGDYFKFGVMSGRNMVSYVIDSGQNAGLMGYDGAGWSGRLIPMNKPVTITASLRRNSYTVTVDGKTVLDWKKGLDHPSGEAGYPNGLYLQACQCVFHVSKLTLIPISGGQGKKLR
jgi:hypothetical protein